MQCPNCGFENIPGQELCARCQGLLDLAGVDVEPPRRAQRTLVRRLRFWWSRLAIAERLPVSDQSRSALASLEDPIRSLAKWMWLPGMAYFLRGRVISGLTFLILWLAAIVLAVLRMGLPSGWFFASLVVSIHAAYVATLIQSFRGQDSLRVRMLIGLVTFLAVGLCLYLPVIWAAGGLARTVTVTNVRSTPALQNGDVIAHTGRWLRPEAFGRGDVVVYDIVGVSAPGYYMRGPFLDRVVGGPGDRVELRQGVLLVNGREVPADKGPLGPLTDVPDLTITAGQREYVILPSHLPVGADRVEGLGAMMLLLSRVPEDRIVGKVFWRLQPLHRFGRME